MSTAPATIQRRPSIFGADQPYLHLAPHLPPGTRGVVLAEARYGLRPSRLLLPHQLYERDLEPGTEYAVLPVLSSWLYVTGPRAGQYLGDDPFGHLLDRLDAAETAS